MAFTSTNTWSPGDEVTSDQLNDLDAKTVAAIDGVAGGTYAAPLNFTNLVGLTVNGLTEFNSDVALNAATFSVGAGSNLAIQNGGFLSVAGVSNFQGSSITTFQNGSNIVHASGSVDTYDDGSSLFLEPTGSWTLRGLVTITPTGTFFCSFGSTVQFASAPTFFFGMTVSAGTTAIAGTMNVSASTNHSGTTNLSGTTTIVGASNRLKRTPSDIRKRIPLSCGVPEFTYTDGVGGYVTTVSPTYVGSTDTLVFQIPTTADPTQTWNVPIFPDDNSILKTIELTVTGTLTITVLVRRNGTNIGTNFPGLLGPGTITISPAVPVDTSTESFSIEISATRGGADASGTITSMFVTCTVSEHAPW